MSFETSQNSGFAPNEAPSSLKERVQRILAAKLTSRQIEEGFLYTKELMLVLGCSERTLIRWRKLRKQGDKTVGIPCYNTVGTYKYYLDDICQYFISHIN